MASQCTFKMEPSPPPPASPNLHPLNHFGYLGMMSLCSRGSSCTSTCRCVCAFLKEDSQGHYSLIRPLWTVVLSPLPGESPEQPLQLAIFASLFIPVTTTPTQVLLLRRSGDRADGQAAPQQRLRWVLMKSLDISRIPDQPGF